MECINYYGKKTRSQVRNIIKNQKIFIDDIENEKEQKYLYKNAFLSYRRGEGYYQNFLELGEFLKFVKNNIKVENIMEIGVFYGYNLKTLIEEINNNGISIGIDWKIRKSEKLLSKHYGSTLIKGDSHQYEMLLKVKDILKDKEIDLLFIDGDHSYEGVKKDYEMYESLVRKGGCIAFHDANNDLSIPGKGVKFFWDEIKKDKKYYEFFDIKNDLFLGIGCIIKE